MVDLLPVLQEEADQEDTQLVQDDIDVLVSKYIVPVDRIRSIDKDGTRADRPIESRIHGLLRFIGFPVVANGNFYNPGFPPTQGRSQETRDKIDNDFESDGETRDPIQLRERDYEQRLSVFSRRDLTSAIYCLLQPSVKPFNLLNEDNQNIQIESRKQIFESLRSRNSNVDFSNVASALGAVDSVGQTLTGVRHILRPFSLDPNITNAVQPDANIIAVPFLRDVQELTISDESVALRPGLELIIRERLRDRQSGEDARYLENLRNLIAGEPTPGIFTEDSINDISLALTALADDNELSQATLNEFEQITNIQAYVISRLVKTIKQLTNVLFQSISFIQEISRQINWFPIVNELGPELDPREASTEARVIQNNIKRNPLDRRLIDLKAKRAAATSRITARENFGNYASPFEINYNDTNIQELDRQIQAVSQQQTQLSEQALLALRNIEIITGEISGVGLIDILAIYVALWAMNEQGLISLLDDISFERLKTNFPELLVGAAADRDSSGTKDDINTALTKFEDTLKNVLDFAQKEFENRSQTSGEEGGSISPEA
jgi:hypothetical protein